MIRGRRCGRSKTPRAVSSHGYDDVDYQVLWDAVQNDVPVLLVTVEQMLEELERPAATA